MAESFNKQTIFKHKIKRIRSSYISEILVPPDKKDQIFNKIRDDYLSSNIKREATPEHINSIKEYFFENALCKVTKKFVPLVCKVFILFSIEKKNYDDVYDISQSERIKYNEFTKYFNNEIPNTLSNEGLKKNNQNNSKKGNKELQDRGITEEKGKENEKNYVVIMKILKEDYTLVKNYENIFNETLKYLYNKIKSETKINLEIEVNIYNENKDEFIIFNSFLNIKNKKNYADTSNLIKKLFSEQNYKSLIDDDDKINNQINEIPNTLSIDDDDFIKNNKFNLKNTKINNYLEMYIKKKNGQKIEQEIDIEGLEKIDININKKIEKELKIIIIEKELIYFKTNQEPNTSQKYEFFFKYQKDNDTKKYLVFYTKENYKNKKNNDTKTTSFFKNIIKEKYFKKTQLVKIELKPYFDDNYILEKVNAPPISCYYDKKKNNFTSSDFSNPKIYEIYTIFINEKEIKKLQYNNLIKGDKVSNIIFNLHKNFIFTKENFIEYYKEEKGEDIKDKNLISSFIKTITDSMLVNEYIKFLFDRNKNYIKTPNKVQKNKQLIELSKILFKQDNPYFSYKTNSTNSNKLITSSYYIDTYKINFNENFEKSFNVQLTLTDIKPTNEPCIKTKKKFKKIMDKTKKKFKLKKSQLYKNIKKILTL